MTDTDQNLNLHPAWFSCKINNLFLRISSRRRHFPDDGIYDLAWSESHDSLLIAAVADVSVKLYDTALLPSQNPLRSFQEHKREVHSVDYNPTLHDSFISSCWDDTSQNFGIHGNGRLHVLPPTSYLLLPPPHSPNIRTFKEHAYCIYSAVWNSRHTDVFASASGDRTVRIWDVREPGSTMIIPGHDFEILCCDWNKYDDCIIATASVDKRIRVWDMRSLRAPILVLNGHGYAVRKVKFSPHHRNFLVSCSYDMTVCM
ncbi:hypothetical protein OIU76_026297 [Salix suchowensis]|nr:hypothetical protein OIU76_026297 [Salix suchowensis]